MQNIIAQLTGTKVANVEDLARQTATYIVGKFIELCDGQSKLDSFLDILESTDNPDGKCDDLSDEELEALYLSKHPGADTSELSRYDMTISLESKGWDAIFDLIDKATKKLDDALFLSNKVDRLTKQISKLLFDKNISSEFILMVAYEMISQAQNKDEHTKHEITDSATKIKDILKLRQKGGVFLSWDKFYLYKADKQLGIWDKNDDEVAIQADINGILEIFVWDEDGKKIAQKIFDDEKFVIYEYSF